MFYGTKDGEKGGPYDSQLMELSDIQLNNSSIYQRRRITTDLLPFWFFGIRFLGQYFHISLSKGR